MRSQPARRLPPAISRRARSFHAGGQWFWRVVCELLVRCRKFWRHRKRRTRYLRRSDSGNQRHGDGRQSGSGYRTDSITLLENTSYTFQTSDFPYSDPNNATPTALKAVIFETLPGAGTITDSGLAVTAGEAVAASDIAQGKVVFTPAANGSGASYASFSFAVENSGGTANGGQDTSAAATAATINVTVTAVNQAPVTGPTSITLLENTSYTFQTSDFPYSDPNNATPTALKAVIFETLPGAGTITDSGLAVTAGEAVAASDIAQGKVVYTPAANGSGASYASFSFAVENSGGTANGGQDTSAAATAAITVTAVDQAPVTGPTSITLLENTSYTFQTSDFPYSDPNNTTPTALKAVIFETLPGAGTITDNGLAVTAGEAVAASDIAQGKVVYTPAANGSGASYASFSFAVENSGGTANGGQDTSAAATATINVEQVIVKNNYDKSGRLVSTETIYPDGSYDVRFYTGGTFNGVAYASVDRDVHGSECPDWCDLLRRQRQREGDGDFRCQWRQYDHVGRASSYEAERSK